MDPLSKERYRTRALILCELDTCPVDYYYRIMPCHAIEIPFSPPVYLLFLNTPVIFICHSASVKESSVPANGDEAEEHEESGMRSERSISRRRRVDIGRWKVTWVTARLRRVTVSRQGAGICAKRTKTLQSIIKKGSQRYTQARPTTE